MTAQAGTDYPALFYSYVGRGAAAMLRRVRQTEGVLPEDELRQALHVLTYALRVDDAWPPTRDLLLELAPRLEQAGYREEWMAFLSRGLEASLQQADKAAEADFNFHVGVLRQRQARYEEARLALASSASQAELLGDRFRRARALNRLAYLSALERRYAEADRLAREALALASGHPEEEAHGHLVMGTIAQSQQRWPDSVDEYQQARDLFERVGENRRLAWSLVNLGSTLRCLGRHAEARHSYEHAIRLLEVVHDPTHLATARMNLGNLFLNEGRYEEALHQYGLAEPVFRQTDDILRLAALHNNRGICYRETQEWGLAESAYLASIRYWAQMNNPISLANVQDGLGLVYLARGRYEEARAIFEEALDNLHRRAGDPERDQLIAALRDHLARAEAVSATVGGAV